MKKQKKNFKFTKKHFTICAVIFALLILVIYVTHIDVRDRKLKDANKSLTCTENIPSSHYHWPDEKLETTNSWTYSDPAGIYTATITYQAKDTSTIHLKRVTKYKETGEEVTEYGALVMPHMSHSQEVFSVINKSGQAHFSSEQSIYTRYGTSKAQTELSISQLTRENSGQDGKRFLFWSDKPTGDFKFVGIVSMSRPQPSAGNNVASLKYVRNIAYSFGAPEVIKVKGAAQYATWAYVDALLHFEIPDDQDKLTTTKLVLSMHKENKASIKIAKKLDFREGTDDDKEYNYSITNENMDIYVITPKEWKDKYNDSSSSIAIEREVGGGLIGEVGGRGVIEVMGGAVLGVLIGALGGVGVIGGLIGAGIGVVVGAAIGEEGGRIRRAIEVTVVVIGGIIGASLLLGIGGIGGMGGIVEVIVGIIVGAIVGAIEVVIGAVIAARIGGEIGELIGARIVGEIVGAIVAGIVIKFYFYDDNPNLDPADPADPA